MGITTIVKGRKILTIVNTFIVKPENQQRLIDVLVEADQSTIKKLPGYISANVHRSLDGTKVTNYTQWENAEALEAMLKNPEASKHIQDLKQLAEKMEPGRYEVVYSENAE